MNVATEHTRDYRDQLEAEIEEALNMDFDDALDWFDGWCLEVEHTWYWSSGANTIQPEESRFLIVYGGPTVRLVYSHRYDTATLYHYPTEIPMMPGIVSQLVEAFAPLPLEMT